MRSVVYVRASAPQPQMSSLNKGCTAQCLNQQTGIRLICSECGARRSVAPPSETASQNRGQIGQHHSAQCCAMQPLQA
jgi:hypothetical protein